MFELSCKALNVLLTILLLPVVVIAYPVRLYRIRAIKQEIERAKRYDPEILSKELADQIMQERSERKSRQDTRGDW